jgi:hypothetical protein
MGNELNINKSYHQQAENAKSGLGPFFFNQE